ncbi:helix-turn-helix domain-containing protein [Streptomyces termitum]|uniref:helix-turn-helix domain-containing protein n=1 Tax=Streptomyces termitum TaxID=67368 RepID=UPI0033AC4075
MSTRSPRVPAPRSGRPPRSTPTTDHQRAALCTEAVREMAEDFITLADLFLNLSAGESPSTSTMLRTVTALRDLTDRATGALVVRHRSEGKPLDDLHPILGVGADRLRKKYNPQQVARELTARDWPRRSFPNQPAPGDPPDTHPSVRDPRTRLARALARAHRNSTVGSQRKLAQLMKIDPSYVSRFFSGDRAPSWKHVQIICETCQVDPALMQSLWDTANTGAPRPTDNPVQDLQTYLKALRFADGSPSDEDLMVSTSHALAIAELRQAFDGPGLPSWEVIRQLTVALQSMPKIALPLWKRARDHTNTHSMPAAAFG